MANKDFPSGFWPHRQSTGGKIPVNLYRKGSSTTAIGEGDLVVLQSTNNTVKVLATTTGVTGVIGVAANYVASGSANTGKDLFVYDSPWTVFRVQSDGTTDADMRDKIGTVAPATLTGCNTTTGRSKQEVDYSGASTGAVGTGGLLKIIGIADAPDNDDSSSHPDIEVLIQRHAHRGTTGL